MHRSVTPQAAATTTSTATEAATAMHLDTPDTAVTSDTKQTPVKQSVTKRRLFLGEHAYVRDLDCVAVLLLCVRRLPHLHHMRSGISFFRRMAWSPDGLLLIVPTGIAPASTTHATQTTTASQTRAESQSTATPSAGVRAPSADTAPTDTESYCAYVFASDALRVPLAHLRCAQVSEMRCDVCAHSVTSRCQGAPVIVRMCRALLPLRTMPPDAPARE
jgi:hypothetical protein